MSGVSSRPVGSEFSNFIPQSAQPYQSIFGDPSSQNVDLEPHVQSDHEAGDEGDDVFYVPLPPIPDDSDDPDYNEGGDADALTTDYDDAGDDGEGFNVTDARGRKKGKEVIYDGDITQLPPSSPPQYRPNRYHGPGGTWRHWTWQERQIAQSFHELRARDLSVHLFNAFAVRRRARQLREKFASGDGYWDEIAGIRVPTAPFVPPKGWTTWPMSKEEVPRVDQPAFADEDAEWTIKGQQDPRPSADIEECLMAFMMKSAKEKFWEREWLPKRQRRREVDDKKTEDEAWKTDEDEFLDIELHPVVQTDDEKSRYQLRPLARNLITGLDNLLMGLHYARQAAIARDFDSETESDDGSVASRSSLYRKRRLTDTSTRSRSRGKKRIRTASATRSELNSTLTENHTDLNDKREELAHSSSSDGFRSPPMRKLARSPSNPSSRSRSRRRQITKRSKLRDWSDVIGIATMTGCPSTAIMRAAKRCSDLFGEDMLFGTLEEGRVKQTKTEIAGETVSVWSYIEEEVEEVEEKKEKGEERRKGEKRSLSRRTHGSPSGVRSTSHQSSTNRRRKGPEAAEATPVAKEEDAALGISDAPPPPQRSKGKHRKQDIVCPVVGCGRHTDSFSRTWNLTLHMRRMHPGYNVENSTRKGPANE